MRILIVDDDCLNATLIKTILRKYGECSFAENGVVALELFNNAVNENMRYDLILMDIMMPELDGLTTVEKIRETEKCLNIFGVERSKILMLTALNDFEDIRTAFENQADGYLVKPIKKPQLINEMQKLGLIVKEE